MKGYKATNKEMRCRNFSYEIGKKLLENTYYALHNGEFVRIGGNE
jgi:hypothetical protein